MGKKSKKRKNKVVSKEEHVANDQNDDAQETCIQLTQKPAATSQYSAAELLKKADEYIDVFQYDLARKFCQRSLEVEPNNVKALETFGFLELQDGNLDKAKIHFGRAIELEPGSGHSKYMYMGQMVTGLEAIQFFQTGINLMKKTIVLEGSVLADTAAVASASEGKDSCKPATARDVSSAYCAIAEIYLTDACDEDDAELRCKESLDLAIDADPTNPESYHTLASFWLCKAEKQNAADAVDKGVSLWLPQLRNAVKPEGASIENPVEICPVSYPARINCTKTLIELEKYEVASEILELLLDENDEVVEVWYLLGLLNYLQGSDFKTNARHYLKKGIELGNKLHFDDVDMLAQMNQLLTEIGPESDDETAAEAEENQAVDNDNNADDDDGEIVDMDGESSSDEDDNSKETVQRQETDMDH